MKSIKTGVDKLVELVSQKKRISLDDAAKQLGVGSNVVQEWAEFLEQEGLVSIDYSLSKIWINEKKITKDDVLKNAKEIISEKDAFVRKVDVALHSLESETIGFEDIRKHFSDIQSHIKSEIDTVKTQLDELQRYEQLKAGLGKDIIAQKKEYEEYIASYTQSLNTQENKFEALLADIEKEKKVIESYKQQISALHALKDESEKIISNAKDALKNVEKAIKEGNENIAASEKRAKDLRWTADKIGAETLALRNKSLSEALGAVQTKSSKTIKQQDELFKKAADTMSKMENYVDTGRKIYDGFKGFFLKNIETEKMITDIENEKNALQKDLIALKAKAEKLSLITKGTDMKEQLKDIESSLQNVDKRKSAVQEKIERLVELIKGNSMK